MADNSFTSDAFNNAGASNSQGGVPAGRKGNLAGLVDIDLGPDNLKQRMLTAISAAKTAYDDEFDRIHAQFRPLLEQIDKGKPRTIIFVDPAEVAAAQAFGFTPQPYLRDRFNATGLRPVEASVIDSVVEHISEKESRLRPLKATITAPAAWLAERGKNPEPSIIVPMSHFEGRLNLDIPGLTPQELSTYVNYHEFFHALDDRHSGRGRAGSQRMEIFADTGAVMEMIRRGSDPAIIDHIIAWREKSPDIEHYTVKGLKALQKLIDDRGVEHLRGMTQTEALDTCYRLTKTSAAGALGCLLLKWRRDKEREERSKDPKDVSWITISPSRELPEGFNPWGLLMGKAIELGGRIAPLTLLDAHTALQREYRARQAGPGDTQQGYMLAFLQHEFVTVMTKLDFKQLNKNYKTTLTQQDLVDIAYVRYGDKTEGLRQDMPKPGGK
ncbi:MAG: hypothetical protein ACAH80_01040 [Alphaproteobacteria bacterium]